MSGVVIDSKVCVICGKVFPRPKGVYGKNWEGRQTCGRDCGAVLSWNGRGRKPRAKCTTCGKPVPEPRMKVCSRACRTVLRQCEWCGRMAKMRTYHKFCSLKCYASSRQVPVENRRCEQCGKEFSYKPRATTKGRFCSRECGGAHNAEHGVSPDLASDKMRILNADAIHESPIAGPYATHHTAKYWFLESPQGITFQARNLKLFIREHSILFTDDQLQMRASGRNRAYGGLVGLKPGARKSGAASAWHGWRWWSNGQIAWESAIADTIKDLAE